MNKMISMKSRFTSAMNARIAALRKDMQNLNADQSGEGYLDMAMKILIIVVIGAAILAIMNTAMPNLFQSLITTIVPALEALSAKSATLAM